MRGVAHVGAVVYRDVRMGVGVRDGAPKPDIATSEAFKRSLLAAKSITYVDPAQGATSGIHFASILKRFGIEDATPNGVYGFSELHESQPFK